MYNLINSLDIHSGSIQALATVVLVIITFYYAIKTRDSVRESANNRMDNRLPVIELHSIECNLNIAGDTLPELIRFCVKNIGYGPAIDISISISDFLATDFGNLLEGKKEDIFSSDFKAEKGTIDKIKALPQELRIVNISYKDIFGRKISTSAPFSIIQNTQGLYFKIDSWKIETPK